ncbi:MAG: TIGR02391 family protein, partial [Chloroflexota bacterium]|nr:TIGR02391 family protein [Chloroflexota bacterium]
VRLRELTGSAETGLDLIRLAFNPTHGVLLDPNSQPGEREGLHLLFRGSFLYFRNRSGHGFPDYTAEEAFDLIVLTNRLYLLVEETYQRRQSQTGGERAAPSIEYATDEIQSTPFLLDTDNDGEAEVVVRGRDLAEGFAVYDPSRGGLQPVEVERIEGGVVWPLGDLVLADVDNDGLNEVVSVYAATTASVMLSHKYRNGRYEVLPRAATYRERYHPWFVDAHITDFDDDGQLEVVGEPWGSVPGDLIPDDYDPSQHFDELHPWGRIRYVWRWNRAADGFDLAQRELLYIGGR